MFDAGPLAVRWYGFFYALGLFTAYILSEGRLRKQGLLKKGQEGLLFNVIVLGVIGGARLGYCLFYNFTYYIEHPIEILYVWQGGLSFHGAFLGVFAALWFMGGRSIQGLQKWGDSFALFTPLGLGFGRIGNFMNSELVGRPTNGNWGVMFERVDLIPRHPSQLYEAVLEGYLLFAILYFLSQKTNREGLIFWTCIALYGTFRFFVEFFRLPDEHLGLVWQGFSQGQILSLPMIFFAVLMTFRCLKTSPPTRIIV